jgi:hypothetical protein
VSATFAAIPPLLLGTEALLGVTRSSRARTLEALRRHREPGALGRTMREALAAGAGGVVVTPSSEARAALAAEGAEVPAWALVPNVPAYVRDASDFGLVGAALRRVRGASPATLVRLGMTGVTHAAGVLASDLAGLVPVLLELECASLSARRLEAVILASTLTDLALAGEHRGFFDHYVRFVRSRFRVRAGFETHNLGTLLRRLREWGIAPDCVIGPVNPRGLQMKPTPEATLAELARAEFPVIAKELRAGGAASLEEGARFARAGGASAVIADLVDLDGGCADLSRLRS